MIPITLQALIFLIQCHMKLSAEVKAVFLCPFFFPSFPLLTSFVFIPSPTPWIPPFPLWRIILYSTNRKSALISRKYGKTTVKFSFCLLIQIPENKWSPQLIVWTSPWERMLTRLGLGLRVCFRSHLHWLGREWGWCAWARVCVLRECPVPSWGYYLVEILNVGTPLRQNCRYQCSCP